MRRLTTEEFIEKAKSKHGDTYVYSEVVYINSHTKVEIICPVHGSFWQTPYGHLRGRKCLKCTNINRSNTKTFVIKANEKHHNLYEYSRTRYKNNRTKVEITCKIHGSFWQTPTHHLQGKGCPKCGRELISRSRKLKNSNSNLYYKIQQIKRICEIFKIKLTRRQVARLLNKSYTYTIQLCNKFNIPVKRTSETRLEYFFTLFLNRNNIKFTQEQKIGKYRVDFLLEDYAIILEVNGWYYHVEKNKVNTQLSHVLKIPDKKYLKPPDYHKNRNEYLKQRGYNVINVWERMYNTKEKRDRMEKILLEVLEPEE